jgi:hypothetical protein
MINYKKYSMHILQSHARSYWLAPGCVACLTMHMHKLNYVVYTVYRVYRVYKKKRNLGISQEIGIVLKTKYFRRPGI